MKKLFETDTSRKKVTAKYNAIMNTINFSTLNIIEISYY